jgi:hypothetical protein
MSDNPIDSYHLLAAAPLHARWADEEEPVPPGLSLLGSAAWANGSSRRVDP